ncbi:hypothetical protein, partial [Limosilactobacillus fermentum]|uniref:hypothetical protein n=1 Tax=Limosilactobacillus fermentum TaxID=1613 RepID=UPI001C9E2984
YHSAKEKALSCFKEAIHPPLVEVGVFSPIMDKHCTFHRLMRSLLAHLIIYVINHTPLGQD